MKAFNVKDEIFWVGAVDWSPPKFGPNLSSGTTYNSYIILDEKIALIDAVKHGFTSENLSRICDVTNPIEIDYVIIGNYSMDHSGSLPFLMNRIKDATIVTTEKIKKAIEKYHNRKWSYEIVCDGDRLSLGKRELIFKEFSACGTETLLTYSKRDKILFSQDLFSQHIITTDRFSKGISSAEKDLISYFVNYLLPFGKMPDINRYEIDFLAPNHGALFREEVQNVLKLYENLVSGKSKNKVTVLYSSIWRGNEKMAYAIADGIASRETEVETINYETCEIGDILPKLFESTAIVFGSPSFKGGISPDLLKLLYSIEKIGLKDKEIGLFSCYTGSISPMDSILDQIKKLNFQLIEPPLEVEHMPSEEELTACFDFGKKIGERSKNIKI